MSELIAGYLSERVANAALPANIAAHILDIFCQLPDELIFEEAKVRKQKLVEEKGRYATMKKFRKCKGCGKEYGAREMRAHGCGISWRKR